MRPRIGINCDVEGSDRRKATLPLSYLDYVVDAGGTPVIIPPVADPRPFLDHVDAVLFIGGDDYAIANVRGVPANFTAVDERREAADLALAQEALSRDLPLLGVCAGFQLIVIVCEGTLYGDIPTEAPSSIVHKRTRLEDPLVEHDVDWRAGDRNLLDLASGPQRVNSHHHQGVESVGRDWAVLARSPDGIIEAAAGPGRFQLGVQWHPERDPRQPLSQRILRSLLEAATP